MSRSPLPQRHGLDAARIRTPDLGSWPTLRAFLAERVGAVPPAELDAMWARGAFVDDDGAVLAPDEPWRPRLTIWFHRELRDEPRVPFEIGLIHVGERIVVADKPHFLSSIPRGRHVRESVIVRLREQLGLPELSVAHRLDRLTGGVLLLVTQQRWRGAYQTLFERRLVTKTYEALALSAPHLSFPLVVRSHIVKERGVLQAREVPGAPANACTRIEVVQTYGAGPLRGLARYRLHPETGKTHQLRLHLAGLGLPIVGDPLYPVLRDVPVDDFSTPLELVARELAFVDPVDGQQHRFTSALQLGASLHADGRAAPGR